jgi:hypothetical protein
MLQAPLVFVLPARVPRKTLLLDSVRHPARNPKKILQLPLGDACPAHCPRNTLQQPVLTEFAVNCPMKTFLHPLAHLPAYTPIETFSSPQADEPA